MSIKGLSSFLATISMAAWGVIAMLLTEPGDPAAAQVAFSLGAVVLGAYMFYSHGGPHVTATGLYGLGVMVFTGMSGLFWSAQSSGVRPGLYLATAAGFWTTLAVHALVRTFPAPEIHAITAIPPEVTRWAFRFGVVFTLVSATTMRALGSPALTQFALVGVGMMTGSLILHRPERRGVTLRLLVAAAITAGSAVLIFSAFGRLMLVALGLVSVVAAAGRSRDRRIKALALIGIAPVTWALVQFREGAQRNLGYTGNQVDGLGSALSPLDTFGRLIAENISDAHGEPFVASALFWVPRTLWEGKPLGLGSAITAKLEPQLLNVGHSMAAQGVGEWFFSWGWAGVVAMVPILVVFLRWLDGVLAAAMKHPVRDRRDLLVLLAVVFLVVEVPVLAWSGSFTYATRGVAKFVIVMIILMFFGWRRRDRADIAAPSAVAAERARTPASRVSDGRK